MSKELLTFDKVGISFEEGPVVHDISFSLHEGEILGLVGESGSGKSTLIKSVMGLLNGKGYVSKGEIHYRGKNLLELSEKEMRNIRGKEIGMIFQNAGDYLCPIRTVGEQIVEGVRAHEKISKKEIKAKSIALFEKFGFNNPDKLWNNYPFELSGGMNQRVGIAIAMLLNPSLLLADEPTSALDVAVQKQVVEEMLSVREEFGTSILIVTHDIGVVSRMADNVVILKNGMIMEYGTNEGVLTNPQSVYTRELLSAVPKIKRN